MASEAISAHELYQFVLDRLKELRAKSLIEEIERSIARGIVDSLRTESSKMFRQLTAEERLSVALEHVVAALDVPVMLARSKEIIDCEQIIWENKPVSETADLISDMNLIATLKKLVAVLDELQLPSPELT